MYVSSSPSLSSLHSLASDASEASHYSSASSFHSSASIAQQQQHQAQSGNMAAATAPAPSWSSSSASHVNSSPSVTTLSPTSLTSPFQRVQPSPYIPTASQLAAAKARYHADGLDSKPPPFLIQDRIHFFEKFAVTPRMILHHNAARAQTAKQRTQRPIKGSTKHHAKAQETKSLPHTSRVSATTTTSSPSPHPPSSSSSSFCSTAVPPFITPRATTPLGAHSNTSGHTYVNGYTYTIGGTVLHKQRDNVAASPAISSSSQDSITMSEHIRLVNQAIEHKTQQLIAIYQTKLQFETQCLRADIYSSTQTERKELAQVISNYQTKLNSISSKFSSLSNSKSTLLQLQLENQLSKLSNIDAARHYQNELEDMAISHRLLQTQTLSLEQQVALLEQHTQEKQQELLSLQQDIEKKQVEVNESRPRLERELAQQLQTLNNLDASINNANQQIQSDSASYSSELSQLQSAIESDVAETAALDEQVKRWQREWDVRNNNMLKKQKELEEIKNVYRAEVKKGMSELNELQHELHLKSHGFQEHYNMVKVAIELCTNIKKHFYNDLICPCCHKLFETPYILWPCSHTLCHDCITVDDEHERLICTVCDRQAARRHALLHRQQQQHDDDDDDDHQQQEDQDDDLDVNFINPYFDPPPQFNGAFYVCKNKMVEKLVEAYKVTSSQLDSILSVMPSLSSAHDIFTRYFATINLSKQLTADNQFIEENQQDEQEYHPDADPTNPQPDAVDAEHEDDDDAAERSSSRASSVSSDNRSNSSQPSSDVE